MGKEIIYNKLVRDKIPEVIERTGKEFKTHIASDMEYQEQLLNKLREEVEELIETPCIEELADILEVVDSIKAYYNFDDKEIQKVKQEKFNKRGGFEKRIILERVVDK